MRFTRTVGTNTSPRYGMRTSGLTSTARKSVELSKEPDPKVSRAGRFAVQVHSGGPLEVQFRDIYLQQLPEVRASADDSPGFHLRTLKPGGGKYVVYLPPGYDGKEVYPVVLFLHGSGQKGQDGIQAASLGLPPALLANEQDLRGHRCDSSGREDLGGRLRRRESGPGRARRGSSPPRSPTGAAWCSRDCPWAGVGRGRSPPNNPSGSRRSCPCAAREGPAMPEPSAVCRSGPWWATTTRMRRC